MMILLLVNALLCNDIELFSTKKLDGLIKAMLLESIFSYSND